MQHQTMRSRVVAVAWAALFALLCTASAGLACKTEVDCQLNGACEGSLCVCDKGWKGEQCGTLNLDPTAHVAYGYDQSTAVPERFSSWGGGPPVRSAEDGKYHLFVSEIAAHCGMSTWDRMSTSVHAIAESIEGPYSKVETVVGTESHNTIYVYSPVDEYHLIYTIFSGIAPESCNPYIACTNGTTPNSSAGSLRPHQPWSVTAHHHGVLFSFFFLFFLSMLSPDYNGWVLQSPSFFISRSHSAVESMLTCAQSW